MIQSSASITALHNLSVSAQSIFRRRPAEDGHHAAIRADSAHFGSRRVTVEQSIRVVVERSMARLREVLTHAHEELGIDHGRPFDTSAEATANRIADFAVALSHSASSVIAEAKVRQIELGHGDAHQVLALAADHLLVRDIFAQILPDLSTHDFLKSRSVRFDFDGHGDFP